MVQELGLIGAGLSVGLAGFGVVYGQGELSRVSMEVLGKSPRLKSDLLIFTVLGIALVESGVIYGMIVAFKIIGNAEIDPFHAIAAGLAMGIAGLGSGFGEAKIVCGAIEAFNRNPEEKSQIQQSMLLYLALAEVVSIYALIVSFQLLS